MIVTVIESTGGGDRRRPLLGPVRSGLLAGTAVGLALVIVFAGYLLVRSSGPYGGVEVLFWMGALVGGAPLVTASAAAAGGVGGVLWCLASRRRPVGAFRTALLAACGALPAAVATWVPAWTLLGPLTSGRLVTPRPDNGPALVLASIGAVVGALVAVAVDRGEQRSGRAARVPAVVRVSMTIGAVVGAVVGAADPLLIWLSIGPDLDIAQSLTEVDLGSAAQDGGPFLLPFIPLGALGGAVVGAAVGALVATVALVGERRSATTAPWIAAGVGFAAVGALAWLRAPLGTAFAPVDPLLLFHVAAGEDVGVIGASDDSLVRHLAVAVVGGLTGAAIAATTWQRRTRDRRLGWRVAVAGLCGGAVLGAAFTVWSAVLAVLSAVLGPVRGPFRLDPADLVRPSVAGILLTAGSGALIGLLAAATVAAIVVDRTVTRGRLGWTAALVAFALGGVLPLAAAVIQRDVEVRPEPAIALQVLDALIGIGGTALFIAAAMTLAAVLARATLPPRTHDHEQPGA